MTSGTITAWLAMLALLQAPASTAASAPEPAAATPTPLELVHSLAQTPPTRTPFAEARFSPLLDRPLVVSGTLGWEGGERLSREVTQPYQETTAIADDAVALTRAGHGTRHFSLDHAPQLRALLKSMVAVLSGDPRDIEGMFGARVDGTLKAWTLTLTPLRPSLKRTLTRLRLSGGAGTLHCLETVEAKGTVSIDLLGTLATKMPQAPTREALATLCGDAP